MSTPTSVDPGPDGGDRVILEPWEELTGELEHLEEGDRFLEVQLSSGTVIFGQGSPAADRLRAQCSGEEGATVSILRTDVQPDPIRVHVDDDA